MSRIVVAKKLTSAVVSFSVGRVITTIIRNNVPQETITDKIAMETASFVLGGMVAERARIYTDGMIDEIVEAYKHITKQSEKS